MSKNYFVKYIIWVCVLMQTQTLFAQLKTYQFEQIDSLQKIEKKHVVVFIHTDWCKYCQAMINTTFKNDSIIKTLNARFYFIDFNAEEKRNIVFNNHLFKFKPNGINTGTHELAIQLATVEEKLAYPTISLLNSSNEIVFQHNQFIKAKDLQYILQKLH